MTELPKIKTTVVVEKYVETWAELRQWALDNAKHKPMPLRPGDIVMVRPDCQPSLFLFRGKLGVVTETYEGYKYAVVIPLNGDKLPENYKNEMINIYALNTDLNYISMGNLNQKFFGDTDD